MFSRNISKATIRQLQSSAATLCCSFLIGCKFGWLSATTSMIKSPNPPIHATSEDIAWMASMSHIPIVFNLFICIWFAHNMSRRTMVLLGAGMNAIVWLLLNSVHSIQPVLIGMFFIGLSNNFLLTTKYAYIGEINSSENRELLGIAHLTMITIGNEAQYSLSFFNNYFLLTMFPFMVAVSALCATYWMVESPYYLISIHAEEHAKASIAWLNCKPNKKLIEDDFQEIKKYVDEQTELDVSVFRTFLKPNNLKLFILYASIYSTACFSSISPLANYGYEVIRNLNASISGKAFMNLVYTFNILSLLLSFVIVKLFNRRVLLLAGLLLSALIQLLCALFFSVAETQNGNTPFVSNSILFLLLLYVFSNHATVFPSLQILKSEAYSYKLKSFYTLFLTCAKDFTQILLLQSFFPIAEAHGQSVNFLLYGACATVSAILVYGFMRETKNKSLFQIYKEFSSLVLPSKYKKANVIKI